MTASSSRLLAFCFCNLIACGNKHTTMAETVTAPTLHLKIGAPLESTLKAAPIPLNSEKLMDDTPFVIDQPITVAYDGPGAFTFPPTRFVMISQAAGVITGIDTSPQLKFTNLADTHALAFRLQTELQKGGWAVVKSYPTNPAELQNLVADPNRTRRFEKDYAELQAGTVSLRIYIKEALGTGLEGRNPPARGNLFLVNTDFIDRDLRSKMEEQVKAKRNQSGKPNEPLPLSVWRAR